MQFGSCGDPESAKMLSNLGYDYIECKVGTLLKPRESENAFREALALINDAGIPCPAANMFFPADLKITGPEVNMDALREYVTTAFERAEIAGVEIIVFGSGKARRYPEGFDRETARQQILDFCRMMAPIAHKHQVTVVAEPLNLKESNIMNTVQECATLVREVNHPGFQLLADAYHMLMDSDPYKSIVDNGDLLLHTHIATIPARRVPGGEECDFTPFFNALKEAGYNGRLSVEAKMDDPEAELGPALEVMKSYI